HGGTRASGRRAPAARPDRARSGARTRLRRRAVPRAAARVRSRAGWAGVRLSSSPRHSDPSDGGNPSLHRLIRVPNRIYGSEMTPTRPAPLAHLELHTPNQARALAFYTQLLGWRPERVEAAGRTYLALDIGEGPGGGVVECGTERPLWLPYVAVPDVGHST